LTLGLGLPGGWWTPPADAAMREGTPREALVGRGWSQDFSRHDGQVAGRSTLEEAESSREDEAVCVSMRWTANEETPQGPAEIVEVAAGDGEPNVPVSRSLSKTPRSTEPSREGAQDGATRFAQRQAILEPPKGKSRRAGLVGRLARRPRTRFPKGGRGFRPEISCGSAA